MKIDTCLLMVTLCLAGLPLSPLASQGYVPQDEKQMVEMLSVRCGIDTASIAQVVQASKEVSKVFGIPPSVVLTILLLESDGLQSPLFRRANNCMGLTQSFDWDGATYCMRHRNRNKTTGQFVKSEVCFRAYPDIEYCLLDFGAFVSAERRWWYNDAFRCPSFDPECWLTALAGNHTEPGYASDWENWLDNSLRILKTYNLRLADK